MQAVAVTSEMIEQALSEAEDLGNLRGSITEGSSNAIGMLGEIVVHSVFGGDRAPTRNYDIVKDDLTYDVKTKGCTCKPRFYWEASLSNWNTKQKCDRYIFVRVEHERGADQARLGKDEGNSA